MLRAAKISGMVLFLATGRRLDTFLATGPFEELFEAIIAENGAVVYFPKRGSVALPFGHLDADLVERFHGLDIPLESGMAIVATIAPHEEAIYRVLQEQRYAGTIEYNRGAIMLLPSGASKGNGLLYALDELGYSPHNVIACGDAENDRSLFDVAELGVAVSNAQEGVRSTADLVLGMPGGAGIEHLLQDLIDGKIPDSTPRPNRGLRLGSRVSGAPVDIDPFALTETNLGITGSSGSGKSWVAGLLVEELLRQKYQVCIIDPEGDYRALASSPRTLLLGGPNSPLPPVREVIDLAEWNNVSLVLDLSQYELEERYAYVDDFLRSLRGLRARRGRPHYFLIDEIQSFCPPAGGMLTDLLL
jgi:hydroxymethylpyrimidine pyrophosphatase-like HAD family hydrolase